ncbi:MAG TPA: small ribosomal subunit Rsm22 family protein [Candidatus Saccharimonadales bacterium]|nr:small ribosomal subunit Rsm22 family protein [Candidatus Saccharimonadales bacterium]
MNLDTIDWAALERLRKSFLDGSAGKSDYWQNLSDLASYDATFAQRIGWKWDYVLQELAQRGWTPQEGTLLDWGCGSGIAHRAMLDFFGTKFITSLHLWDRSPSAMSFAQRRATDKYPGIKVEQNLPASPGTVLISHVLSELEPRQVEELADAIAATGQSVLWVEPGTYEASLTLIAIRERLRDRMNVVAPCTHQQRCGILDEGNESHWCHHFAKPPSEIFQDGNWTRFAKMTGIDLRSLPLSFLVLDKRPVPTLPPGATRLIGHPRVYKPYALALASGSAGVTEYRISKRTLPEEFRKAKKGILEPLQVLKLEGKDVVEAKPLYSSTKEIGPEDGEPV